MNSKGEISDYFNGTDDIRNKIIRCVGCPEKRFEEDALRIMRAVRFSSQLGYENDETLASIYQYYCTWDAMNEELKRVYGYTSTSLLKLQGHYNTIYNIKGDF